MRRPYRSSAAPAARRPARAAVAVAAVGALLMGPWSPATATPDGGGPADRVAAGRQADFTAAAREHGVPESVLLAVSYHQTRWEAHAGQPSKAAGYGPMHLTDGASATRGEHHGVGGEDPRGDETRPKIVKEPGPAALPASLRTLELAAKLTGIKPAMLRGDAADNIRGGAALLAHYQGATPKSADPGAWYGAVARYSGAEDVASANRFADDVFATIRAGAARVTADGHQVALPASPAVAPQVTQVDRLGLRKPAAGAVECPPDLGCEWIPAPYEEWTNPDGSTDYGNHDKSDRPKNQQIRYIIIHDTESTYADTLGMVQDPTYVSWHYTLRNQDGHIAQHVPTKDVGWHAGNWYVNAKSIGLEHEGYAARGTWYSESMYRTSARLVRYLANRYGIPLDRQHILGHDNVPGILPANVRGMHWDTGPYWDWAHYFELLGAPLHRTGTNQTGMVTVKPNYATNKPAFTGCEDNPGPPGEGTPPECGAWNSSAVVLRSEPRDDAPLLVDIGLHPDGSRSTMYVSDHGSRVSTGQQYAVAERRGEWTAVWYLGQKGWLRTADVVSAAGMVVTPKAGRESVPVYGRAYPEAAAYEGTDVPVQTVAPLQYVMPAGQRYSVGQVLQPEFYFAKTLDTSNHRVIRGQDTYYQIQFGHRVMFVRAADVDVQPSWAGAAG